MRPSCSKVLLIGGAGFIGRHLAQSCLQEGIKVRIADVAPISEELSRMDIEYSQGRYDSDEFLANILCDVDFVVHLAHESMLLDIDSSMAKELDRNIKPIINLLDACCRSSIRKFLFVSSGGTVYGSVEDNLPIPESAPTNPISLYGASKLIIERIGMLYHAQKNLQFTVARPSNAYGPGQIPFRGQGFIATALGSAIMGKPLEIFGDGNIVRDYIYVQDIANALLALLVEGGVGEVYNVSTSHGITITSLLDEYIIPLLKDAGYELEVIHKYARSVDVPYNVLINKKIKNDVNFIPSIQLNTGLRKTLDWLQLNIIS